MKILAISTDEHSGSKLGLCPPEIELYDGGTYLASKAQRWIWQCHQGYWDGIAKRKKKHKCETGVVHLGDHGDLNKHGSYQYISMNQQDVKNIALRNFEKESKVADWKVFLKGTAAHGGKSGWFEDWIAEDLDAIPDPETGEHSWIYCRMQIEGLLCEFYHHPGTVGRLFHTEQSALDRMSAEIFSRCHDSGEPVPDLVFYGHVHYYGQSSPSKKPHVVYCPGWQLSTDFVHRIGRGYYSPRIGGLIVTVNGKDYTIVDDYLYRPQRKVIWNPSQRKK